MPEGISFNIIVDFVVDDIVPTIVDKNSIQTIIQTIFFFKLIPPTTHYINVIYY